MDKKTRRRNAREGGRMKAKAETQERERKKKRRRVTRYKSPFLSRHSAEMGGRNKECPRSSYLSYQRPKDFFALCGVKIGGKVREAGDSFSPARTRGKIDFSLPAEGAENRIGSCHEREEEKNRILSIQAHAMHAFTSVAPIIFPHLHTHTPPNFPRAKAIFGLITRGEGDQSGDIQLREGEPEE